MCEPTTIMMAATAAQGLMQYQSRSNQMDALEDQRQVRQNQIESQAASKARDRAEVGRSERARIKAAAAESGVTGASVDAQFQESFVAQSMDIQSIEENTGRSIRANNTRANAKRTQIGAPGAALVNAGLSIGNMAAKEMEDPTEGDG